MNDEFPADLRAELLDDFYAECDEHLTVIRVQLAALERSLERGEANPAALESLYRSAHSFKGNSAIVGLTAAEALAHAAEGVLRQLSQGELPVDGAVLDLLGQVGHRLEQIVTAHRLQQPLPDTHDLLDRLAVFDVAPKIASDVPVASAAASFPKSARDSSDAAAGARWQARFSPTPELDGRGININAVRARLAALGEIISAVPQVDAGKMSFVFLFVPAQPPADLAAWEADGIRLQPEETGSHATPSDAGATKKNAPRPSALPSAVPTPTLAATDVAPSSMFIAPSHIVRVDLSRLDDLMRIAGEMVIQRSRLDERIGRLAGDRSELQEVNLAFSRSLRELREAITRVRLVPVAEIFTRLPFVVRDLARDTGKKIRLTLEGEDTEIDKYLVERLKEPLLHLVRNALSHGVESPAERVAAGKPEAATLVLRASAVGDSVLIQIRDDGRGVDARKVAARAAAAGLPVPAHLDEPALLNLICTSGFSTREEADRAAGRGVGMAVVANTVRELGGSLSLETTPGAMTQFTLRLPLTLSIAETFIVSAAGQTCAVPQSFVEEVVLISTAEIRTIKHVEVVPYRGSVLPIVRLRAIFGAKSAGKDQEPMLVIGSERGTAGLVVDRVHGQREVVVRPMQDPLIRVPGISGATELGDGKPVLILDAATLTGAVVQPRAGALRKTA